MSPLPLFACLVLSTGPALSAESPALTPSSAASASDQEQNPSRDPFASATELTNAPPKIKDPLQSMNRAFFTFNDKLYFWVLKPAAKGYSKVAPRPVRTSVGRFFANVKYPVHLVNNLLQGKIKAAGQETCRFVVNSTVGVAGFFDPAKRWKLEAHTADFDQTLGFYGMGPGIYFDWPVFGPSSVRGSAGLAADSLLSPWSYIDGPGVFIGVPAYNVLNSTSLRLGEYESFKKATLDPYVAMRSAYYETRAEAVDRTKGKSKEPNCHP